MPNIAGDASFGLQIPDAFWDEIRIKSLPGFLQVLEGISWHDGDQALTNSNHRNLSFVEARARQVEDWGSVETAPDLLALLTFLASNSFDSYKLQVTKFMVRLIAATNSEHLIGKILSVPGPSMEALGEKLLKDAIALGNLRLIRVLLDSGLDLNSQIFPQDDSDSVTTPLCYAIEELEFEVVQLLLKCGADPNGHHKILTCQNRPWPLGEAIEAANYDLVKLLIDNGASSESEFEQKHQNSALMKAVARPTPGADIVRLLLDNKARVDFVDEEGGNCLINALISQGDWDDWYGPHEMDETDGVDERYERYQMEILDVCRLLVEAGASLDCQLLSATGYPRTALERAADLGLEATFRYLLGQGARLTNHCIYYAAHGGNEDLVHFLLDQGFDPNSSLENLEYPLLAAIRGGHSGIARTLVEHGADVEPVVQLFGSRFRLHTPLQAACRHGDSELVAILLHRGADVNARASHDLNDHNLDHTALSAAIENGQYDVVCMLLDAGADVNTQPTSCGSTALTSAIDKGMKGIVERLLSCGARLEGGGLGAPTALQAAIRLNDRETVNKLLSAGANIDEWHECETPLTQAIEANNYELVHRLIDAGADINNPSARLYGRTALEAAAAAGNSFLFRRLLSIGADPFDPQALLMAVKKLLDIGTIKALLERHKFIYGQMKKGFGGTALQMAVLMKNMPILEALLDAGIPADSVSQQSYHQPFRDDYPDYSLVPGETALGTAIRLWEDENMSKFFMKLLSYGANPSGPVLGTTPPRYIHSVKTALVATIEGGKTNLLQKLLDAGANVSTPATGTSGQTALQAAAWSGRLSIVRMLFEHGAQVDEEPAEDGGVTALQAASIGGYTAIVSLLLKKGANVNASGARHNGRTALEGAAEYGRIATIQLLLDAGAAVHGEGEQQYKNSLQYATKAGHLAAMRLLQRHHANSNVTTRRLEPPEHGTDLSSPRRHDATPEFTFEGAIPGATLPFPDPGAGATESSSAHKNVSGPFHSAGDHNFATEPVLLSPSFEPTFDFDYPIMDIEDIFNPDWLDPLPEQPSETYF